MTIGATSDVAVHRAGEGDTELIVDILGDAFMTEEVTTWLFPDAGDRRAVQEMYHRPLVAQCLAEGEVLLAGEIGVALWLPVSADGPEEQGFAPEALPERLAPYALRLAGLLTFLHAARPNGQAYRYLPFIGVRAGLRGGGIGTALLRRGLAESDELGLATYLETASPRAEELYAREGFRVVGEPGRLPAGPVVRGMWREPNR